MTHLAAPDPQPNGHRAAPAALTTADHPVPTGTDTPDPWNPTQRTYVPQIPKVFGGFKIVLTVVDNCINRNESKNVFIINMTKQIVQYGSIQIRHARILNIKIWKYLSLPTINNFSSFFTRYLFPWK